MLKYLEALEELPKELKGPLVKVLELFKEEVAETVKRSDFERFEKATEENFNRVWKSIEELTEAQKRTEERLDQFEKATGENFQRVWKSIEELTEAQKRTEERLNQLTIRVNELTEAQRRTEEEIRKLAIGMYNLRGEVGGLARSFGYAFENEAFRMLPKTLKERYGIEITERFIRTEIGDYEINILGLGRRDGTEVVIVGEAKTRLERMEVFDELDDKAKAVKEEYKDREVVKVLVTHFATKRILKTAEENGIIVIQSFQW
ncbi:MAG: hypothetical protein HXY47_07945 [Nitrospirae bacterium]|nr:hypothetical protein [Nitrospirota bacterium]